MTEVTESLQTLLAYIEIGVLRIRSPFLVILNDQAEFSQQVQDMT